VALPNPDLTAPLREVPVAPSDPTSDASGAAPLDLDIGAAQPALTSIAYAAPAPVAMRTRLRGRAWQLLTAALVMALGVSAFYGYSTTSQLKDTETTLADTQSTLTDTQSTLTDTQGTLDAANATIATRDASLATAENNISQLRSNISQNQAALAAQKGCIAALQKDSSDQSDLLQAQIDLYNMSAKSSAWEAANQARDAALLKTIGYYYEAYSAAWDGSYSAANSWIAKGNAQVKAAATALSKYNAEVEKINDALRDIEISKGILEAEFERTKVTCGFTSGSSGESGESG